MRLLVTLLCHGSESRPLCPASYAIPVTTDHSVKPGDPAKAFVAAFSTTGPARAGWKVYAEGGRWLALCPSCQVKHEPIQVTSTDADGSPPSRRGTSRPGIRPSTRT